MSTVSEPPSCETVSPKVFKVGTLVYTKAGLFILFAWLLWADLVFQLMESCPQLIPLKLKGLDTPNWLLMAITSTLPAILNLTVCPWVSLKSDRHRGRWGRRLPFILSTAPFLTLALVGIGFSQGIAGWLNTLLAETSWQVSAKTSEIIVVAVFATMFAFFNMFVASVFWYLFNDVVPTVVMSRFLSALRIVSTGATTMFNFWVFPHVGTHMKWIMLGGALLYFVSFTLVCLNVKEGEYPPPPENVDGRTGVISDIKTYGRECYGYSFYWLYFLYNAIANLANCIFAFGLFLMLHLGLSYADIGFLTGLGSLYTVVLLYPAGILVDRIHPMRGALIAVSLNLFLIQPVGLVWLFYDPSPKLVYSLAMIMGPIGAAISAIGAASSLPLEMHLFPKSRFGQFGSANALVRSAAVLVGGIGAGFFMDYMKYQCGGNERYYRYMPVWWLAFAAISYVFLVLLYFRWKKMGGAKAYFPPGTKAKNEDVSFAPEDVAA